VQPPVQSGSRCPVVAQEVVERPGSVTGGAHAPVVAVVGRRHVTPRPVARPLGCVDCVGAGGAGVRRTLRVVQCGLLGLVAADLRSEDRRLCSGQGITFR